MKLKALYPISYTFLDAMFCKGCTITFNVQEKKKIVVLLQIQDKKSEYKIIENVKMLGACENVNVNVANVCNLSQLPGIVKTQPAH